MSIKSYTTFNESSEAIPVLKELKRTLDTALRSQSSELDIEVDVANQQIIVTTEFMEKLTFKLTSYEV